MFRLPPIDRLSFLLGFVAASLFWWLVGLGRPFLPRFREQIRKFFRDLRDRNLQGVNNYLRKETIRRAQRAHLAANLFPLDDILIEPRLLAPPPAPEIEQTLQTESIVDTLMPYLPDWPELASSYGVNTLSISEALQGGSSIAVIGQPGSGKSVALAFLANQLARKDPRSGSLADQIPIYFHILDLDLHLEENHDPLSNIQRVVAGQVPVLVQPQMTRFLRGIFSEGSAVLIIDGLDELHPTVLPKVYEFLNKLREKYPHVRIAAAASPFYMDGLTSLGLVPLALASWDQNKRMIFLDRWNAAWSAQIQPDLEKQSSLHPISPLLLSNWLRGDRSIYSPLEWTIKIWGAYMGDLKSPSAAGAIETYVSRFVTHQVSRQALEALAREFAIRGEAAISYSDLEKVLSTLSPASAEATQTAEDETSKIDENQPAVKGKNKSKDGTNLITAGDRMLTSLLTGGILTENIGEQIRFVNPQIAGYLACFALSTTENFRLTEQPWWALANQILRYTTARGKDTDWISSFIRADESPLYRHLFLSARWLPDSPTQATWRSGVFRSLVGILQNDKLPTGMRGRAAAALAASNDASISRLAQQLLTDANPITRQLAVLTSGAIQEAALVTDLLPLLADPEPMIRHSVCMALAAIQSDAAVSAITEALLHGDEYLRQAAAESLVHLPERGVEMIRQASQVDDLITRRAAVFGLLQIHETWSQSMLEDMAINDGQWVVRNAAAQALETLQGLNPHIPKPLPLAWESAWLITFASKRGQGVIPDSSAAELLGLALTSGTIDDQMAALGYLKNMPDESILLPIYKLFYGPQAQLSEAALYTLWFYAISGVRLPSPGQYGLGG